MERGRVVPHVLREIVSCQNHGEVRRVAQVRRLATVPPDVKAQTIVPQPPVVARPRVPVDHDAFDAQGFESGRDDESAVAPGRRGQHV